MRNSPSQALAHGDKFYQPLRRCKNGHEALRYANSRACIDCARDQSRVAMGKKRECPETRKKMQTQWREWYHSGNQQKRVLNSDKWRAENPDQAQKNGRASTQRFRSTPEGKAYSFAAKCLARCRVNKTDRTFAVLGYNRSDLMRHIEGLFTDGMTWDNHGEWHIDHIVPISFFIKTGETDPRVINALENLQPLWASENISKGGRAYGQKR